MDEINGYRINSLYKQLRNRKYLPNINIDDVIVKELIENMITKEFDCKRKPLIEVLDILDTLIKQI